MVGAHLGPLSAKIIALIMMKNENFCKYDLSQNYLGDEGTKLIAEALIPHKPSSGKAVGSASHIISLNLSSNAITDVGFDTLFNCLEKNSSIIELNISSKV